MKNVRSVTGSCLRISSLENEADKLLAEPFQYFVRRC